MFQIFKTCRQCSIFAPVDGSCMPIEQVSDPVFAKKLLGDGMAFQFCGDTVYAPCDGTVMMLPASKHAIGFKAENGTEILVHVGLNTVELQGEGFQVLVGLHQKVHKGDPVMNIDRDFMKAHHMDLTTPMVITNMELYTCTFTHHEHVQPDTIVMYTKRK